MTHILVMLLGVIGGAISVFLLLEAKRRRLDDQKLRQDTEANRIQTSLAEINARNRELDQQVSSFRTERAEFDARVVSYRELQNENGILKHDLQNIDVNLRKLELDRELQRERQQGLDQRSQELGSRFLKDNVKWIGSSLTANNFINSKERLQKVIEWCRGIGLTISPEEETTLLDDLRTEYEKVVRAAFEREEQARIKAQIREEQMREKEIERELQQLERERIAIQAALTKALAEAKDEHSAEIERLRARLAEAEEKTQRAISQAQVTKSGNVYVISNLGSFGEDVFKIGMTRRLEPLERVKELSDASVPFPFDVHMMISSDNAPALENALHRNLHTMRINKINPRKEFFRTNIEAIRRIVEEQHGKVDYVADCQALEYRQSLAISNEDQEYIESIYDGLYKDSGTSHDES